ncbi:MAG: signal peptidase I [Clostridia bacterium]|nr:signal peptidase I [Clostridia bacterium]
MENPRLREALDWGVHILIAVAIALFIVTFVAQRTVVFSISMQPTLYEKDNLIVEKITPRFGSLKPGDIVTIKVNDPSVVQAEHDPIIKRVIAVEGDTVEIKDGHVKVNGKIIEEKYIKGDFTREVNPAYSNITVPKGSVYVLGDNRSANIVDSRQMGPVQIDKIQGRAIFRFLPFSKIGTLE